MSTTATPLRKQGGLQPLIVVLLALIFLALAKIALLGAARQNWEYSDWNIGADIIGQTCTEQGKQGWEVCAMQPAGPQWRVIFKRPTRF